MVSSPGLPACPWPPLLCSSLSRSQVCPHQEYLLTRLALLATLTTNMLSDKVGRKNSRTQNNVRSHPRPVRTPRGLKTGQLQKGLCWGAPATLPVLPSNTQPVAQGTEGPGGPSGALGLGEQASPGRKGTGWAASYLGCSLGRLTSLSPLPRPASLCAHGL